jgi:predicted AAA+ superfamily ATPase
MIDRELYLGIWREQSAEKNMVFMAGPRQAGKTTLGRLISKGFANRLYWRWDIPRDRAKLIKYPAFFEALERRDASTPCIVLDEIHKYRDWKNYLKGVYDDFGDRYKFLISGSGRLDLYQKGGDSLAGRYLLFYLWPFTLAELGNRRLSFDEFWKNPLQLSEGGRQKDRDIWENLSRFSGFPEPYLIGKERSYLRWSRGYAQQLIREDIRDLTDVKLISDLETLYELLPSKVGSPLSITSLAQDLKVAYNSVSQWLSIFERFFMIIRLSPWTGKIARAIQRERKVYLWDSPRIEAPAQRFENMVALELWRAVQGWNDLGYGRFSLHFIKNKEQEEVDFLIADRRKPLLLVEAKQADSQPTPALKKFQEQLRIPAVQLVQELEGYRLLSNQDQSIMIAPAFQWLAQLP